MPQRPRPVLHGIDQCCADYENLPGKGNMGSECFTEDLFGKHIYEAAQKDWLPMEYVVARWDYANEGGAVGFIDLNVKVPAGTIIMDGFMDVVDPVTSGGAAQIGIKLEAAAGSFDVLAQAVLGTNGTLGLHDVVPVGTAATAFKLTSAKWLKMQVTVAALTGGAFVLYLRCFRGFVSEEQSSSSSSQSESSSSSSSSSSVEFSSSSSSSSVEFSSSSSSSSVEFSSSSSSDSADSSSSSSVGLSSSSSSSSSDSADSSSSSSSSSIALSSSSSSSQSTSSSSQSTSSSSPSSESSQSSMEPESSSASQ